MFRSKNILWITFAFCITTGCCEDVYQRSGADVNMDCLGANPSEEIEWKLNNVLVLSKSKTGRERKGSSHVAQKARIDRTMLKITAVKSEDSGVYTCKKATYTLYVVSAHANPSSVLHSTATNLNCQVSKDFKGTICWSLKDSKLCDPNKDKTLKSVTSDNAGPWTCFIKNDKGNEVFSLTVTITVVGPLNTSGEVTANEQDNAELSCNLPAPSTLPITGGSWTRETAPDISFPALMRTGSVVKWNSTGGNTNKVTFSDQPLDRQFSVTLKKVKHEDAGVYVCSLEFEGGRFLRAKLTLKVLQREGAASDDISGGSSMTWYMPVHGVQLWVWVATAVSAVVLVGLIVIIVVIYRRNKRMKRKMKKSLQQPLTSRDYCKCDRPVRQPRTGKRERPPPLPRHHYSSLNG